MSPIINQGRASQPLLAATKKASIEVTTQYLINNFHHSQYLSIIFTRLVTPFSSPSSSIPTHDPWLSSSSLEFEHKEWSFRHLIKVMSRQKEKKDKKAKKQNEKKDKGYQKNTKRQNDRNAKRHTPKF